MGVIILLAPRGCQLAQGSCSWCTERTLL